MILREIFDSVIPWTEKQTSNNNVKQYTFEYDDQGEPDTYWVIFTKPPHNSNTTHINFISAKHGHAIANRDIGQYVIISTILDIVSHYDKANKPAEYRFEAEEPSRIKLYDRICKRLLSSYHLERAPNTKQGVYIIYRV
jgi:hypothetical protein